MNSLPPELVSSIVESAAESNALYDSYKFRQLTLSALSLVNRTFYSFAQPLLLQKVYFKKEEDVRELLASALRKRAANSFTYDSQNLEYYPLDFLSQHSARFTSLTEMRLVGCRDLSLATFKGFPNLTKLCLQEGYFDFNPEQDAECSLPSLVELTLECMVLQVPPSYEDETTPRFLSPNHFPALRVLGLCSFKVSRNSVFDRVSPSLLAQLDCLATNDLSFRSRFSPFSTPILFDIAWDDTAPSLTEARLRIRLPYERSTRARVTRAKVRAALSIFTNLLDKSAVLKEVYLDLFAGGGSFTDGSDGEVAEKIKKLEDLAREKGVEIIWENQMDDWCRGRVSKEFWRRSRENRGKEKESG